jgi:hypothetical protein
MMVSVSSYTIPQIKCESFRYLGIKSCETCLLVLPYLPVLVYESEIWSVTLRGEHRLRPSKDRVLRKKFGPKREEVRGETAGNCRMRAS